MRILVTGACGFAGSQILRRLREVQAGWTLLGMDNFCRPGSERNWAVLKHLGVTLFHGDVRSTSDFEALPAVDWVINAAANPSVLAGVDGRTSRRHLVEHNLGGTVKSTWCGQHFGHAHPVERNGADRPFDIPWLILDDVQTRRAWDWRPQISRDAIFAEVAAFAETEPQWLSLSAGA